MFKTVLFALAIVLSYPLLAIAQTPGPAPLVAPANVPPPAPYWDGYQWIQPVWNGKQWYYPMKHYKCDRFLFLQNCYEH